MRNGHIVSYEHLLIKDQLQYVTWWLHNLPLLISSSYLIDEVIEVTSY